jgi:nitrite reductase/ring-hydroxylating ferredoxin subunit
MIVATVSSFLGSTGVVAYSAGTIGASFGTTRRSTMTMRKGRKGLNKGINESIGDANIRPMGGESTSKKASNWVPVAGLPSMADLPNSESPSGSAAEIKLVDTMADVLMNGATNPTGAVAVTNYRGKTYCFASACSTCKIPLTKARVMEPNDETNNADPRLICDLCSTTFNLRTGVVLENAEKKGFLGGIVSGLLSSAGQTPLPTYDLGEQNGKVLINLPIK